MALNHCEIMGRITKELELKQTPSGKSVISFTVAVDRGYKNANNENITDFINCVAWNNTADFICKYFGKGRMICLEGSIQTRSYTDANEQKRTVTEINVDNVHFTGEKKENATESNFADNSVQGFTVIAGNEDDLPF